MKRLKLVAIVLAVAVVPAAAIAIGAVALGGGDDGASAEPSATAGDATRCADLEADEARECYTDEFYAAIEGEDDPRDSVAAIADSAWEQGGFLLANCHGLMHTVARRYVESEGVTLATLMDYLPQSNDPGCTAGFAHGLVTGVTPDIDPDDPRQAASVCTEADTRYQRYSCTHGFGHAFMRLYGEEVSAALELCTALGKQVSPDCAQGVYHDYWFAVNGADDTEAPDNVVTDPRDLCGAQPRRYVRPCWYRAFLEVRPEGFQTQSGADIKGLCLSVEGLQQEACITGASVIGPPDPAAQLQVCAELRGLDAVNCIRGTKVQNLLREPFSALIDLIQRCDLFPDGTRRACYQWLGKTLSVVTDGEFERQGCSQVITRSAQRACVLGARSTEGPLVTFS